MATLFSEKIMRILILWLYIVLECVLHNLNITEQGLLLKIQWDINYVFAHFCLLSNLAG